MSKLQEFFNDTDNFHQHELKRIARQNKRWKEEAKKREEELQIKAKKDALRPRTNIEKAKAVVEFIAELVESDANLKGIQQSIVKNRIKDDQKRDQASLQASAKKFFKPKPTPALVPEYDNGRICLFRRYEDYDKESLPSTVNESLAVDWTQLYQERHQCSCNELPSSFTICQGFQEAVFSLIVREGTFEGWTIQSRYHRIKNVSGYEEIGELLLLAPN